MIGCVNSLSLGQTTIHVDLQPHSARQYHRPTQPFCNNLGAESACLKKGRNAHTQHQQRTDREEEQREKDQVGGPDGLDQGQTRIFFLQSSSGYQVHV